MYDIIAQKYSQIFPLDPNRVEFIISYFQDKNKPILDIGCATGDLVLALGTEQYNVIGIDLNDKMISIAKKSSPREFHPNISFKVMNMLDVDFFDEGSYQGLLCFGNTLPHLKNTIEVSDFFKKCYDLLCSDGIIIIQILNFDKILRENKMDFPIIEKDDFKFIREYRNISEERIEFFISIEDKLGGKTFSDSNLILPLRQEKMKELLTFAGFKKIEIYSGYDRNISDLNEFSTLYIARK